MAVGNEVGVGACLRSIGIFEVCLLALELGLLVLVPEPCTLFATAWEDGDCSCQGKDGDWTQVLLDQCAVHLW